MIEVDLPPKVEALVVRTPTAWYWIGSLSDDGYLTMQLGSGSTLRTVRVHRYVCELQWASSAQRRRRCTPDETSCVRPTDLYPGSQAANLAQMARHGRSGGRYHRPGRREGSGRSCRPLRRVQPRALQAALAAGDPHLLQLVLF